MHGRAPLHRNADDPDGRIEALQRRCDTGDQPPARDGDDGGGKVADLVADFQAEGPLPGNDIGMIEGWHQGHAFVADEPVHLLLGIVWDWPTIRTSAPRARMPSTLFCGTRWTCR